jgi:hypothetical protein
MKDETFRIMYQDYLDYQGYYKTELDWDMKESFEDYVQRSIDNGELEVWADSNRFFSAEKSSDTCSSCEEKLEEDEMILQCSDCYEDGCSMCMDDFCGDCDSCKDCCECKCSVCDGEDWRMTETSEGNVCRSCYEYCHLCESRRHPEQMASGASENYCKECVEDLNSCESCGDYLQEYDERSCVNCFEVYCESCSDKELSLNEEDEQVCTSCVPSKTDKKSAEDSGMTDKQIVELIDSQFWHDWTTSTTPVNPGWWNLTISVRDLKMWTRGIKANRHWKVSNVKDYFNIRGNKESLVTQIEAIQRLIDNLQQGDSGSVARVNGIIEEYFDYVPKE